MITRTIFGRKARFHDTGCADGFREDRKRALIYPVVESEKDPRGYTEWESASVEYEFCAYCGFQHTEDIPEKMKLQV